MDTYACDHLPQHILEDSHALEVVHNIAARGVIAVDASYGECGRIESIALSSAYLGIWLVGCPYAVGRILRDSDTVKVHWNAGFTVSNGWDLAQHKRPCATDEMDEYRHACPLCRAHAMNRIYARI